jgi:hypothetical protein
MHASTGKTLFVQLGHMSEILHDIKHALTAKVILVCVLLIGVSAMAAQSTLTDLCGGM